MLNQDQAFELIDRALALCGDADGAEVALGGGELALTRFANSEIHQNVQEERIEVSVRAVVGKHTARASTSRLDDRGLAEVAQRALEAARRAPEDEDLLPLFEGSDGGGEEPGDPIPAPETPEGRAEHFSQARSVLQGSGAALYGFASTLRGNIGEWGEAHAFALGNSAGVRRFSVPAQHALSLTVGLGENTAWAHAEAPSSDPIDAESMAHTALAKARGLAEPRAIEPGEMTVILESAASANLMAFLTPHVTGRSVEEDQSCLTGRVGERVFGEGVTIRDDVRHRLQQGVDFDAEGVPRQTVTLVEGGVVEGFVHDRRTAARAGVDPTGHGLPIPSAAGSAAQHLVMEGGEMSLEEMIASTDRGVLITRSWYTNFVDFKKALITGMTRDGTFLIEGGQIVSGLRDLRFNMSLFELLGGIDALGSQGRFDSVVAPAMRVQGFRFTS
jgi:PmbA protein